MPVVATDNAGHLDAGLEIDDVLVLEDGKPQQIRSVRHIPANVLLLLDTGGGDLVGLGGMAKRTSLTRDVALRVLSLMRKGDSIALIQSGDRADVFCDVSRRVVCRQTPPAAGDRGQRQLDWPPAPLGTLSGYAGEPGLYRQL